MKILLLFFFTSCSNFNKNKELTLKQIDKNSQFLKKIENLSSQKQNYQEPFKNFLTKTIPEFLHRNTNGFVLQKSLPDLKNFNTTSSDITISTLIEILDLSITYFDNKNNKKKSEHLFQEILKKFPNEKTIIINNEVTIVLKEDNQNEDEKKTPSFTIIHSLKKGAPRPFLLDYILEIKVNNNVPFELDITQLNKPINDDFFTALENLKKISFLNKKDKKQHEITISKNQITESFFLSHKLTSYKRNQLSKLRSFLKKIEYNNNSSKLSTNGLKNDTFHNDIIEEFEKIYKEFSPSSRKSKVISSYDHNLKNKDPRFEENRKNKNFELSHLFKMVQKHKVSKSLLENLSSKNISAIKEYANINNYLPYFVNESTKRNVFYHSNNKTKDFHAFWSLLSLETFSKDKNLDDISDGINEREISKISIQTDFNNTPKSEVLKALSAYKNADKRNISLTLDKENFIINNSKHEDEILNHNKSSSLKNIIDKTIIPDIQSSNTNFDDFLKTYLSKTKETKQQYFKDNFILKTPVFVLFHHFIEKVTNTALAKKYSPPISESINNKPSLLNLSVLNLNAYLLFHHRLKKGVSKNYNEEKYTKIVEKNAKNVIHNLIKKDFLDNNPPDILTLQELFPMNQAVFSNENKSQWVTQDIENKTIEIYKNTLNEYYKTANYIAITELPQKAQQYDFSFFDLMQPYSLESFSQALKNFGVLTMKPLIRRVLDDVDLQVNPGPSGLVIFYNKNSLDDKKIQFEGSFFKSFSTDTQDYNNLIPLSRGILEGVFSWKNNSKKYYFTVNTSHFSTDDSFIVERINQTSEFIDFTTNFDIEKEKALFTKRTNHLLGTNLPYDQLISSLDQKHFNALNNNGVKHGTNIANFFLAKEQAKLFSLSLFDGNFDPLGDILINNFDDYNLTKVPFQLLIESKKFTFLNSLMKEPFTISYLKDDKDNFINKSNIVDKEIQSFSGEKFFIPKAHFHQFTSYSHQIEELQKTILKNFLKTSKKESIDSETIFGNFFKEHLKKFHNLVNKIKAALKLTIDHLNVTDFNNKANIFPFLINFFSAVKNFYSFDKLNSIDKAIFLKNQYNLEAKNTKLPLGKVIDHALLHIVDPDNTPFAIIPSEVVNFSNKASDHEGILIKKLSIYNAE